jgi:hypothetical protein
MSRHLTQDEIERYVSRKAPVDDILAAAEHLDDCFDCRDRAAALVDDGSMDRPHARVRRFVSLPPLRRRHRVLLWAAVGVAVVAIAVAVIEL